MHSPFSNLWSLRQGLPETGALGRASGCRAWDGQMRQHCPVSADEAAAAQRRRVQASRGKERGLEPIPASWDMGSHQVLWTHTLRQRLMPIKLPRRDTHPPRHQPPCRLHSCYQQLLAAAGRSTHGQVRECEETSGTSQPSPAAPQGAAPPDTPALRLQGL